MPRRLAMAKHAPGFDAVGWTLLGFLLGASLAVFALLHADFRGMMRPLLPAPAPEPPAAAVVSYTPPASPVLAGPSAFLPPRPPTSAPPTVHATPPVSALASAGAASARGASVDAAPKPTPAQPEVRPGPAKASVPTPDAQVEDDAAAAGMTSKPAATPDLY
jgi:hypothetical protein